MIKAIFTYSLDKTTRSLIIRDLSVSSEEITSSKVTWEDEGTPEEIDQTLEHTYTEDGTYRISLVIVSSEGTDTQELVITFANGQYSTSTPIILRVNDYLFDAEAITEDDKWEHIRKWQLFLYPLVNHDIDEKDIYNELVYTELENLLIAQLVALDILMIGANKYLQSMFSTSDQPEAGSGQEVKKITTGPTEVEWFQGSETWSKIMAPGGLFNEVKSSICTLANRVQVPLPICPARKPYISFINSIQKT